MAESLSGFVQLKAALVAEKADAISKQTDPLFYKWRHDITAVLDPATPDQMINGRRTLGPSASEELELIGVIRDKLGVLFAPERLYTVYFRAAETNLGTITIGGAASEECLVIFGTGGAAGSKMTLRPGAWWLLTNKYPGWSLSSTHDRIKVANDSGAGSAVYDFVIVGGSD